MCRGFQPVERELLKINSFYTHISLAPPTPTTNKPDYSSPPDYLTLHYLPRISGGGLLEIDGSNVRPDSPAFVTLHRVLSSRGLKYGSRERVVACEGARFDIYVGDVQVLRGIFRRDDEEEEEGGQNWNMECKCVLNDAALEGIFKCAEVSVAAEGSEVMTEKVDMTAAIGRRRRKSGCCQLEEIPEVREGGSDLCGCSECCGGDEEEELSLLEEDEEYCEMEEGVRWALDVGIWVVCFGVGYLVCKASNPKSLMRKQFT